MINLTLKIRSAGELQECKSLLLILMDFCYDSLSANEYFHFYNMMSITKKVFDKQYQVRVNPRKKISVKVNINEFESWKLVDTKHRKGRLVVLDQYREIILLDYFAQLDKHVTSIKTLPLMSSLSSNVLICPILVR